MASGYERLWVDLYWIWKDRRSTDVECEKTVGQYLKRPWSTDIGYGKTVGRLRSTLTRRSTAYLR